MSYVVPSQLQGPLQSEPGRTAVATMFEGRLRDLHGALEKAIEPHTIYAIQGRIAEVRELQKTLSK